MPVYLNENRWYWLKIYPVSCSLSDNGIPIGEGDSVPAALHCTVYHQNLEATGIILCLPLSITDISSALLSPMAVLQFQSIALCSKFLCAPCYVPAK